MPSGPRSGPSARRRNSGDGMTEPVGVVLAGGASRRMGTDKAFVAVDGRSMVLRVADALVSGGCGPLVCQGGDPRRLA
ncbi:MAG: molybdenum cofactor guanylyltransferase, partial [Ilumatobacteraceae bacterium]